MTVKTSLPADLSQVWPEANQHFSKEIDDEANSYFQRIYNHPPHPTMSVDEVRCDISAKSYKLTQIELICVAAQINPSGTSWLTLH